MGKHRAHPSRARRRARSTSSVAGKRRRQVTPSELATAAPQITSSRQPAITSTRAAGRRVEPSTARASRAPGRRRAARRSFPFAHSSTIPSMVGAAVLVASAGAAFGLGAGQVPPAHAELSSTSSLTGTDADILSERDIRAEALSRDSQRLALDAAVDEDLKSAAEQQSAQRSETLAALAESAAERSDAIARDLWVLPTSGYRITAHFGRYGGLWSRGHTGMDLATSYGTPIVAIASGVITSTGYDGAYGNKTVQTLDDGTEIWYAHQASVQVTPGTRVVQGQQIGLVGSSGRSTGAHLHIEVRPGGGDPVNPYTAFIQHGVTP